MRPNAQMRVRAELLAEVTDVTARAVQAEGLAECAAQRIGVAVCDALATNFGGALIYIPNNLASQTAARDAELLRLAETESPHSLARIFGMSLPAVYKSLSRARARSRGER